MREGHLASSILSGKTCRNIASEADLSVRIVEYYRYQLMRKLKVLNHN